MSETAQLQAEIARLKSIIRKLIAFVLVFHRITNHNRIGKSYVTVEELHEINLINQAITLDLASEEWEV